MKLFSTDGCSVLSQLYWVVTFGRKQLPWRDACIEHDIEYWLGGTKKDKLNADIELMNNVVEEGYPTMAALMFLAVRVGGIPWLPFPWRWGFGHKFPYKYRERTDEDGVKFRKELNRLYQYSVHDSQ